MIVFSNQENKKTNYFLTFFILLLLLPHFEPGYFDTFDQLDFIYNIARVCSGIIAFLCVLRKGKISAFFLSFAALECWMFAVTVFQKGAIKGFLINIVSLLVLGAIVECFSGQMIKHLLHAFLILLEILIYTNFFTILIFPNGLYDSEWQSLNWLLGYRNSFILYILLALFFSMIWKAYTGNSLRFYLLFTVCALTILRCRSATGLLTFGLFVFLYVTKPYRFQWFHSYSITGIWIAGFFLLVIFRLQNIFAPLFQMLGRNVTLSGRTYIWDTTLQMIMENPFIGYGKQTADYRAELVPQAFAAIDAHNYILEILFAGGAIALLFATVFFAKLLKKLYTSRYHLCTKTVLIIMSCYFAVMLTETLFVSPLLYTFFFIAWRVNDISEHLSLPVGNARKICFQGMSSKLHRVNYANKKIRF